MLPPALPDLKLPEAEPDHFGNSTAPASKHTPSTASTRSGRKATTRPQAASTSKYSDSDMSAPSLVAPSTLSPVVSSRNGVFGLEQAVTSRKTSAPADSVYHKGVTTSLVEDPGTASSASAHVPQQSTFMALESSVPPTTEKHQGHKGSFETDHAEGELGVPTIISIVVAAISVTIALAVLVVKLAALYRRKRAADKYWPAPVMPRSVLHRTSEMSAEAGMHGELPCTEISHQMPM